MADPPPRPRRRRRRLVLLLALELVGVLALLELGLRLAEPRSLGLRRWLYLPGVTRYEDARDLAELLDMTPLGFTPKRQRLDFVLNSRGLKTQEYSDAKPAGTRRVLVLGDSFVFASGEVPHGALWHQRLEAALTARGAGAVEVLALGWPGVGPSFYRRMWELEGSRLEPDLVLVGLFVGNDFRDTLPRLGEVGPLDTLARHCYVARLVRNALADRGTANLGDDEEGAGGRRGASDEPREVGGILAPGFRMEYDPRAPSLPREKFLASHERRLRLFERAQRSELEEAFAGVREHLEALRAGVAAAGARMVLVVIPNEVQVNPKLAQVMLQRTGTAPADLDLEAPGALLRGWCDEAGVPCLDLTDAFRTSWGSTLLYRRNDTHWSVDGNALAAERLLAFLDERGLLP